MSVGRGTLRIGLSVVVTLAVFAGPAEAARAPKSCGFVTVSGKRYEAKAALMRCRVARERTISYLKTRRAPRGYTCKRYPNSIPFICRRGQIHFLAVKR